MMNLFTRIFTLSVLLSNSLIAEIEIINGVFDEQYNYDLLQKASDVFQDAFNDQEFDQLYKESMSNQFKFLVGTDSYKRELDVKLEKKYLEKIRLDRTDLYFIAHENQFVCVGVTWYLTRFVSSSEDSPGSMRVVMWEFEAGNGWRALNLPFLRFISLKPEATRNHLFAFLALRDRLVKGSAGFSFEFDSNEGD